MERRAFLGLCAGAAMAAGDEVMTVRGAIPATALGVTLVHEHLFSSFGSDPVEPGKYDTEALLQAVVPYAKKVKELGAQAIVDCTAALFGREPALLRRISEAAGLHILTNTGYYAAANDRYVPPAANFATESGRRGSGRDISRSAWTRGR